MLTATQYVKRGPMIVLREGLDDDDPESWPSLWREKFGDDLNIEVPTWRKQLTSKAPAAPPQGPEGA